MKKIACIILALALTGCQVHTREGDEALAAHACSIHSGIKTYRVDGFAGSERMRVTCRDETDVDFLIQRGGK